MWKHTAEKRLKQNGMSIITYIVLSLSAAKGQLLKVFWLELLSLISTVELAKVLQARKQKE